MKKLVLLLVCMFTMHTMVMADNDKPIQVNQLPAKAQTFINTYFKDHKVALAKEESGMFYKSYDVVFTNGEEIEFDKAGEWKEVKESYRLSLTRKSMKSDYPTVWKSRSIQR